jgi:hypothetical protein
VLYAAGDFTNAGGIAVANIARWDGTDWSALGGGLSNGDFAAWAWALAVNGTNLYAGGFFTEAGGVTANCIARWNGANWSALGSGVDDRDYLPQVTALAVSGSDLYVGGAFTQAGNGSAAHVARWNGANWSAVGDGVDRYFGDIPVTALAVSGTRLIVGGRFVSASGVSANKLAEWNGGSWTELAGGATGQILALGLAGNNVTVGGGFAVPGQAMPMGIGQWNGTRWSNVSAGGGQGIFGARSCVQIPSCIGDHLAALAMAGRVVYAGGNFSIAGGTNANNVARWSGSSWSPLGSGFDGPVSALAWKENDLLAGGSFMTAGSVAAPGVAHWDGTNWSSLGGGVSGSVFALVVRGGEVFAGGAFSVGGVSNLARWDGASWSPVGGGLNGPVLALALGVAGELFVGGKFTSAGGVGAANVARWDGDTWSALGAGVSGVPNPIARFRPPPVSALAVLGTNLFVGGDFAFAGGSPATNLARWNGASWSGVGGGLPGVSSFAPPPAVAALTGFGGLLYVGGSFPRAGGAAANGIARWDGTSWSVFGDGASRGISSPPSVSALAVDEERICVGGHFKFAGGKPASDFSLWHSPPKLRITRLGNSVQLSWPGWNPDPVLQASETLSSTSWRTVTNAPVMVDGENQVLDALLGLARFYRLVIEDSPQ